MSIRKQLYVRHNIKPDDKINSLIRKLLQCYMIHHKSKRYNFQNSCRDTTERSNQHDDHNQTIF